MASKGLITVVILVVFLVATYFIFFRWVPAQQIGNIQVETSKLSPLVLSLFKTKNGSLVISTSAYNASYQKAYPQDQIWINWWFADGKPLTPNGSPLGSVGMTLNPLTTNSDLSKAGFTKDALLAILQWNNYRLPMTCPCPTTYGVTPTRVFTSPTNAIVSIPAAPPS